MVSQIFYYAGILSHFFKSERLRDTSFYPTGRVTAIKETAEAVVLFLNAVGINVKLRGWKSASI
jgi:hypothetical protein